MKRFSLRLVGLAIGIAATAGFAMYVAHLMRDHDLGRYATSSAISGIALAAFAYCFAVPFSALAWRILLGSLGTRRRWRELAGIIGVTQIGKYLPGNVGHFVGRGGLALARGMGARPLLISIALETILTVLAGVVLGFPLIALSNVGPAVLVTYERSTFLIALALMACSATAVLTLRLWLPPLAARISLRHAATLAAAHLPGPTVLVRAFACYCAIYLAIGAGLFALAQTLLPGVEHDATLLVGAFAFAWIVGFATPGAPAGLGVREAALFLVLGSAYAEADAAAIIIALRLATTAGDLLCVAFGAPLLASAAKSPAATEP